MVILDIILIFFNCPGYLSRHVTLGIAHSAGPHLILISLVSSLPLSLMSQGLVLSNVPCSSRFSDKTVGRATLKNPVAQV